MTNLAGIRKGNADLNARNFCIAVGMFQTETLLRLCWYPSETLFALCWLVQYKKGEHWSLHFLLSDTGMSHWLCKNRRSWTWRVAAELASTNAWWQESRSSHRLAWMIMGGLWTNQFFHQNFGDLPKKYLAARFFQFIFSLWHHSALSRVLASGVTFCWPFILNFMQWKKAKTAVLILRLAMLKATFFNF